MEQANARAPKYARIKQDVRMQCRCSVQGFLKFLLQMIIITSETKPLEYTPKGTPRRPVCLKTYEDEIEALYAFERDEGEAAKRQFPDRV